MLTHIPEEMDEGDVFEPVVVVHQPCRVGMGWVKIDVFLQLRPDAFNVPAQAVFIQEVSFFTFHTRVTNHSGCPTYQGNGPVPGLLQMNQEENGHEAANMEAVSRGIKSDISGYLFFLQDFLGTGHDVL